MKSADDIRSSSLDISDAEMRQLSTSVSDLVNEYFASVPTLRVFPETSGGAASRELGTDFPLEPQSVDKLLQDCRTILYHSCYNGIQRFCGNVASPTTAT